MRTSISFLMILFLVCLSTLEGRAQTNAASPKKFGSPGIVEVGGSVTFSSTVPVRNGNTGDATTRFSAYPYVGVFVVDGLELGANPLGVGVATSGNTTLTDIRMLFAPSYNFRTATMVTPFIEGLIGITSQTLSTNQSSTTESGLTWGGRFGIKAGVAHQGLLVIGVQYLLVTLNPSGVTGWNNRSGYNELSISAGWTVWF